MLDDGAPRRLHALGATGIGVSGLLALFRARGWEVSGCDSRPSSALTAWLTSLGVTIDSGHDPVHIADHRPDLVLRSPAVADDNPELVAAQVAGVPVVRRGEALAALVNQSRGVAVCGTHGKTTTSCFGRELLARLGDKPSWCIGGNTPSMGAVAGVGASGAPFVVEADESDGTLALYRPHVTVVTCVEPDHMEHFSSFDALKDCFRAAVRATSEAVVCCADNAEALDVCVAARTMPGPPILREGPASSGPKNLITYGFADDADVRCEIVAIEADRSVFDIVLRDGGRLHATIGVPGRHNVLNATGAFAACIALGHEPGKVAAALGALTELPGRRYERHFSPCGAEIVSDYAHHPTEIAMLVAMARLAPARRLIAVFQPHRYTRTRALGRDFPAAFKGVDELLLLPVYEASENPLEGGRTEDLYCQFRRQSQEDAAIPVPKLVPSVTEAAAYLATVLQDGDRVLVVGAGDVVSLVSLLEKAKPVATEPKPVRTSFGTPATADCLVDVRDETELASLLAEARAKAMPVHVVGQGTNLLISDIGVRGLTLRLSQDGFGGFERLDETTVCVGCALSGARLLALLRDAGLSGLEFMAGIPGCVGGWLAMNAGTRFGEFGDRVVAATAYGFDGAPCEIADFGFGYRTCKALERRIAVAVTLRLVRDDPAAIARRMDDLRAKRFDFSGLRTAGSVFRNPPGVSAGKLLDEAGCKGLRVGGAVVCDRHANIVAAEDGATASDIIALSALMRDRVAASGGVDLHREIQVW
jgi:UDP-N-acetylmuramate--L-alanine ligase/UDP-N-acetylenolpyruvoylglucosamine reductase